MDERPADLEPMTPEQDAELRRLAYFASVGAQLSIPRQIQKQELRARDRREEIREPVDELLVVTNALG